MTKIKELSPEIPEWLRGPERDQLLTWRRLSRSTPDDSDETVAQRIADFLLVEWPDRQSIELSVLVNARPPYLPGDYRPRKGTLTFKTQSRQLAAQWIVRAALAGHRVSRKNGAHMGTITEIREHARRLGRYLN
jgi:hypothetical protein